MLERKRDSTIDVIKGIGIVLMVYRHARGPFSEYVVLFHMALFFIASGYLYNGNKIKNFEKLFIFIIRKIQNLWIPYFSFTVIYILLNNIFIKINIYTNDSKILTTASEYLTLGKIYDIKMIIREIIKAIFFQANTQMGGALWFFGTLFNVIILFAVLDYIFRKTIGNSCIMQGILSLIFLMIGYLCGKQNIYIYGLARTMSVYSLIYIGVIIKKFTLMKILENKVVKEIFLFGSCIMIIIGKNIGTISVVGNRFKDPVFFLLMSISGWILVWSIAKIIVKGKKIILKNLCYISQHSVYIIGLHFLCFKLVSLAAVIIYAYPAYRLAEFPILMRGCFWALIYTIIGIIIPLIFEKILKLFFSKIKS